MSEVVLDASALIAYMNSEPGQDYVEPYLDNALLSTVNLAEVATRLMERGHQAETILHDIAELGVLVVPFSETQALETAKLRPQTRYLGLSLGDRACLALGLEYGATVLTADKPWQSLPTPHQIEVIR